MKNYKIKIFVAILLVCIFSFCYAAKNKNIVCIRGVCIETEIAASDDEKIRGLMFRKALKKNKGMLFIFSAQGLHSFWMKNMNFPIDIIWIDENKKIVDIKEDALPCRERCESFVPKDKAMYALEVVSGFVSQNNIEIGNEVKFNLK